MAERVPPSWLQGGSHTAENDRNLIAMLVATGGIVSATDLAVTAPGGTMSVSVAAGDVLVKGSRTRQGVYHCINDAAVLKTIGASDPTNPRKDRVVAEVRDAAYSGAINDWRISVVQGTPAASPAEPAIPADCIELALINVPATATSINSGNIVDRRVVAAGGSSLFLTKTVGDGLYVPQPASPTALQFIRRNAGNTGWEYAAAGSSLLAKTVYAPGTAVTYTASTTANTLTVLDTTNLTISFTAPASGAVLIRLTGFLANASGSVAATWGLVTHGGTTLVAPVALMTGGASSPTGVKSAAILVSGLTPGTTYTYDWVHSQSTTSSLTLVAQGYQTQVGAVLSATPTGAPAAMEVWSA